ncbi:MAG: hypothetical protein ABFC62_05175 [Clostridiaceae bacterium]|nr:hypothetical protein [Eubacteriales bacterium]
MLRRRKLALAILCAALLLLIGALLTFSMLRENKQPSGGSRFVCAHTYGIRIKEADYVR